MRTRTQVLVLVVACCCAASPPGSARAQPGASRTSAFVARGDLVSAELTSVDPERQLATTVTVNAYSGLAFPGESGQAMPRRLVVLIDRRQSATGAPVLFAIGTASSFQLDASGPASATLRAVVAMYGLAGEPLFDVNVDLGWTAAERPRALHWVNPFNVPGLSSVFHALDGASEASVAGRVALGEDNFAPARGDGVLALGARVIVGIVPRAEPGRALADAPLEAPAVAAAPPRRRPTSPTSERTSLRHPRAAGAIAYPPPAPAPRQALVVPRTPP